MSRSLWLLIRLQIGGWLRAAWRSLATLKGAALAVLGVVVFLPWIASLFLVPPATVLPPELIPPDGIRTYGPSMLLLYCVLQVLVSPGERTIYFTPAEVSFLFSGPFTRREILLYKVASTLIIGLPVPLFMFLMFRRYGAWDPATLLAVLLLYTFMTLFTLALGLVLVWGGERVHGKARKGLLLVGVVLGAALLATQGGLPAHGQWGAWLDRWMHAPWWQAVVAPVRPFFEVFLAGRSWPALVQHTLLAVLVNGCLVGVILALDADYLEAVAASSERTYQRLRRARAGQLPGGKARFSLPSFPWWGGVGPIFWRQAVAATRGLGRLAVVTVVLMLVAGSFLLGTAEETPGSLTPAVIGLLFWMTMFITVLVPFDFRGDVDRIAFLKTIPIPPWRLALGQLLAPTLLLTLVHAMILTAFYLYSRLVLRADGETARALAVCIAFSPPTSFLLLALENLLFLLFPVRIMATTPGDFQSMGRNVLLVLVKTLGLFVVGVAAAAVGFAGYLLGGGSLPVALAAAWVVVASSGLLLLPLIGVAFGYFDVGRDTPE